MAAACVSHERVTGLSAILFVGLFSISRSEMTAPGQFSNASSAIQRSVTPILEMPKIQNKRFIELSHAVKDGMVTYKGLPAPVVSEFRGRRESRKYYADGVEFHIGKIEMVGNTGHISMLPFTVLNVERTLLACPLSLLQIFLEFLSRLNMNRRSTWTRLPEGI